MFHCEYCSNMFKTIKILRNHQLNVKYCLKIQKEKSRISSELYCQYCKKSFKTKYVLHIHQTQAKYCLKLQASQNSQEIISSLIECKYCNKTSSASNYVKHDSICKKKFQFLLNEKTEENAKLKAEKDQEIGSIYKEIANRAHATIEEIAKKPTYQKTSTRNIQNNLVISNLESLDLNKDIVASVIADKYTRSDFYEGQKGAAQVVYKHLVTDTTGKPKIICTDAQRGIFHHKDLNGEHVIDYKNDHLIKTVHAPLKKKACEIAVLELATNPLSMKEINMHISSISELDSKPGVFNTRMAQLTGKNCARIPIIENTSLNVEDLTAITEIWLNENIIFLTMEHIFKGPEGYAEYSILYPLKDRVIIIDNSDELIVKYKDADGVVITDPGGNMITQMLFSLINERNKQLIMEHCMLLSEKFLENGNKIVQLLEYKSAVENGKDKSRFREEFISCLLNKI